MEDTFLDNEGEYFLLDYSPSHSQLILRNKKSKVRDYNIDIVFKPVHGILIPTRFSGIEIILLNDLKIKDYLINNFCFNPEINIYQVLNNKGNVFYINASVFSVYQNNFDILETSFDENKFWLSDKNKAIQ